jgi:hypothetical protein
MHESAEALQRQKANLWVPQTLLLEAEILGDATQYQHLVCCACSLVVLIKIIK